MNSEKVHVWGRSFDLDIVFEKYKGEEILPVQTQALKNFLISQNCIDESLDAIKQYCLKWNKEDIGSDKIDNIFKYVKPKSLYIQRTKDDTRVVVIMCAYKFYSDNKIAVVFKNEKFDKVVIDDEVI